MVAMGIIVFQWMRYEERQAVRADRALDALEAAAAAERVAPGEDGTRLGVDNQVTP
jgi:hypothetical protein